MAVQLFEGPPERPTGPGQPHPHGGSTATHLVCDLFTGKASNVVSRQQNLVVGREFRKNRSHQRGQFLGGDNLRRCRRSAGDPATSITGERCPPSERPSQPGLLFLFAIVQRDLVPGDSIKPCSQGPSQIKRARGPGGAEEGVLNDIRHVSVVPAGQPGSMSPDRIRIRVVQRQPGFARSFPQPLDHRTFRLLVHPRVPWVVAGRPKPPAYILYCAPGIVNLTPRKWGHADSISIPGMESSHGRKLAGDRLHGPHEGRPAIQSARLGPPGNAMDGDLIRNLL